MISERPASVEKLERSNSIVKPTPPDMHKRLSLPQHRRPGHLGHYNQMISPKITLLHHLALQPAQPGIHGPQSTWSRYDRNSTKCILTRRKPARVLFHQRRILLRQNRQGNPAALA